MGKTTAGLPLEAGQHYERCPACATVYRTKRAQRFRCPACHRLAYAVATPDGEEGARRVLEADPTVYRVIARRRQEGEEAPAAGGDVVLFLEEPDAAPPAPAGGESRPGIPEPPGAPGRATRDAAAAATAEAQPGVLAALGRWWRGE